MDELKPHQLEAVAKLDSGKILVGDVGTGKSWVAMEYYMQKEAPRDIFIITTAKKRDSLDWVGEAARYGIGRSQDATVAGVLTVDSWNNIGNYTSVKDAFFIFDEQRLVGSGAWTKAFIHIAKSNRWILLSATPGDTWLDYIPVFVANRFYRNRTHFKREHVVYNTFTKFPKVDHYIGVNKLVKIRNHLLVEMPMVRHTTRNTKIVPVGYDRDLFEKVMVKRWHVYENRPLRDVAELFSVMRKVVNSDTDRLSTVKSLMKIHPKLIVFYNFDYELEILRTLANAKPPSGGMETGIPSRKQSGLLSETSSIGSDENRTPRLSSESSTTTNTALETKPEDGGSSEDLTDRSDTLMRKDFLVNGSTTAVNTTKCSPDMDQAVQVAEWNDPRMEETECTDALYVGPRGSTSATDVLESSSWPYPHGSSNVNGVEITEREPPKKSMNLPGSSLRDSTYPTTGSTETRTSVGDSFSVAEWNGHKHQPIPETDRWVYLVQYTAGSEGWNCVETNAMCFYSLTYSYKQFHQAHGRIDRMNTLFTQLYYYILRSNSAIDKAVWTSISAKKSFNESAWRKKLEKRAV